MMSVMLSNIAPVTTCEETNDARGDMNLAKPDTTLISENPAFVNLSNNNVTLNTTSYVCNYISNVTSSFRQTLPDEMKFTDRNIIAIILYCMFFVVAASGNLTVFLTLFRNKGPKARVNLYIMHLSLADLIVTFIMMPMEIGWHVTVDWRGGDALCRILMFFRAFGLYLSSFVLVVISLDRYFAILHPLSLNDSNKRGKTMIAVSWICSAVASAPQFELERGVHASSVPDLPYFSLAFVFTGKWEAVSNSFN